MQGRGTSDALTAAPNSKHGSRIDECFIYSTTLATQSFTRKELLDYV